MPIDYKEYPANWKWLSRQIIATADIISESDLQTRAEIE
jgi:hypothetical protein